MEIYIRVNFTHAMQWPDFIAARQLRPGQFLKQIKFEADNTPIEWCKTNGLKIFDGLGCIRSIFE